MSPFTGACHVLLPRKTILVLSFPSSFRRRRPRSVRPSLEQLEDRFLPTVDFFGGPVIPHVEVNTLFLGQQWTPSAPNNLNAAQNGLNSYLQALVNSPYMDMLGQ